MRTALVLLFLYASHSVSYGQEKLNYSINDCISYALQNQPSIKKIRLDEQLQKEVNNEVVGMTRPQITANGQFQYLFVIPKQRADANAFNFGDAFSFFKVDTPAFLDYMSRPREKYSQFRFGLPLNLSAGIQASQLLFDAGVFVALQARKSLEELSILNTERSEQELKINITKAYYNCVIAEKRLALLNDNITLLQNLEGMTRKLYNEGFAEKIDADRLTVQRNNLMNEKTKIDNLIELSYLMLKFQMGMPLHSNLALSEDLTLDIIKTGLEIDPVVNYDNRIEMKLLQTAKKLNEYDLKRHQKSYLPTVAAAATGSFATQTIAFKELFTLPYFPTGALVLNASMPIWDGNTRRAKVNQAKINLLKADLDISSFKNAVDLETGNARAQLKNSLISLENQEKNIELALKVYEISQRKFKEGLGSNIEMLQAETAYKEAQTNYFNSLYEAAIAKIDLQKALGLIK